MKNIDKTSVGQLTDTELIEQTDALVLEERKITIQILRHLREIEVRRLFISLGFSSMYEYCLRRLKYSEGQAIRRLSSARLMTELPEIEKQIETGDLNLTNLSKIQSFVRAEKSASHSLNKVEKLQLISDLEHKSTREVERELIQRSYQPALLAEKFHRTVSTLNQVVETVSIEPADLYSQQFSKFETILGTEHQELLQEFRNLYAHELTDSSSHSVLVFLLEKAVQHKKKKLGLLPTPSKDNASLPLAPKVDTSRNIMKQRHSLKISIKKKIWQRAQACCEHQDSKTNARCTSRYALEIDHIKPIALGGSNEIENLQLLCRSHNSRRSVETFGLFKK
jgi:5-methylcytosine-specific restriction endonuclease McrA